MAGSTATADGFDVVVVGAGVVGLAIAARLAAPARSLLVLEREPAIARGITSRNSEVVHAGLYYPKDSLKARSCVAGRERLYAWCEARRVGYRKLGKLVVATRSEETATLEALRRQGQQNGVQGLELLDAPAVTALEPGVACHAALWSPESGIVDGHALCLSLLAEAESRGAVLAASRTLTGLTRDAAGWRLEVTADDGSVERLEAGCIVDAAGLDADRVATLAGLDIDALGWRQHLCKGDYFVLGAGRRPVLSHLVYPVPVGAGLGIHATLDLAGRVRFGPDARYVSAPDYEVDAHAAERFRKSVSRYLPALRRAEFLPDYAGVRPRLAKPGEAFRDFVVEEAGAHGAPGFVACLGIESPGLTAALELAEVVAARLGV